MPELKVYKVDDTWSIEYNSEENDRITNVLRHGEPHAISTAYLRNVSRALFAKLLQVEEEYDEVLKNM